MSGSSNLGFTRISHQIDEEAAEECPTTMKSEQIALLAVAARLGARVTQQQDHDDKPGSGVNRFTRGVRARNSGW